MSSQESNLSEAASVGTWLSLKYGTKTRWPPAAKLYKNDGRQLAIRGSVQPFCRTHQYAQDRDRQTTLHVCSNSPQLSMRVAMRARTLSESSGSRCVAGVSPTLPSHLSTQHPRAHNGTAHNDAAAIRHSNNKSRRRSYQLSRI